MGPLQLHFQMADVEIANVEQPPNNCCLPPSHRCQPPRPVFALRNSVWSVPCARVLLSSVGSIARFG